MLLPCLISIVLMFSIIVNYFEIFIVIPSERETYIDGSDMAVLHGFCIVLAF